MLAVILAEKEKSKLRCDFILLVKNSLRMMNVMILQRKVYDALHA